MWKNQIFYVTNTKNNLEYDTMSINYVAAPQNFPLFPCVCKVPTLGPKYEKKVIQKDILQEAEINGFYFLDFSYD